MDKPLVYICINYEQYSDDDVIAELYDQNDNIRIVKGNSPSNVELCSEFWCFGDCSKMEAYKKAVDLGVEIWQMM